MAKLSQEPNPFEQSFSLAQTKGPAPGDSNGAPPNSYGADAAQDGADKRHRQRPSSTPADGLGPLSSLHRVKLPPVAAINGPIEGADMSGKWGAESLRSGPLSPAMLGRPTGHPAARATARATPRLGVSDPQLHTGLTPFIASETHPAAPAVGFNGVKMSATSTEPATRAHMSPDNRGLFAAHDAPLEPAGPPDRNRQPPATTDATVPPSMSPTSSAYDPRMSQRPGAAPAAAWHTGTRSPSFDSPSPSDQQLIAAGPRARADAGNGRTARRRLDRPSGDHPLPPAQAKRARTTKQRAPEPAASAANTKEESAGDDDEKRKLFLERNRQAAFKCRQRKKQHLQELQERYDYVVADNERLRAEFAQLRDYAMRARALLAAHADCPVARANGVFGPDALTYPAPMLPGGPDNAL